MARDTRDLRKRALEIHQTSIVMNAAVMSSQALIKPGQVPRPGLASGGDGVLHCHMTHHVMNQMGHEAPNMVGVNTAR